MAAVATKDQTNHQIGSKLLGAVLARREAERGYRQAILEAKEEGWNNTQIAMTCGVSEAAIRLYLKRHGLRNLRMSA